MEILLGLLCVLVVLFLTTVVGHGLWLMVGALFGSSPPEKHRPRFRQHDIACIGCAESFSNEYERCPSCGLDPDSKAADELRDLEAAARTVQRMLEKGSLPADTCEAIYKTIEARQEILLPSRRPQPRAKPTLALIERWFGDDLGESLTTYQKKQALAWSRSLTAADLRGLSARMLVGIARLQASVGLLSRACQVYAILFDRYPRAAITAKAGAEAIRAALKLDDPQQAAEFAGKLSDLPGLVERDPELAELIEQVLLPSPGTQGEGPGVRAILSVAECAVLAPSVAESAALAPSVVECATLTPSIAECVALTPNPGSGVPGEGSKRRSFAEWIAVFMEQSNILWGELIGGTLIVGCSIALVISLWTTLSAYPIVPFLIFAATTLALIGAGFYTLHHWKLESTSRGLLLIGTLLVPLNFLVLAGVPRGAESGVVDYLTEVVALAVFGWLFHRSARILVETPLDLPAPSAMLVAVSMLVSAVGQLYAPRLLAAEPWDQRLVYLLTLVPVLVQLGAMGWLLYRLAGVSEWSIGRLAALLIALGGATFACGITLAYPLYAAADLADVLPMLSPALTLFGVPILIAGVMIHQQFAPKPASETPSDSVGLWRTLGTGLALLGVFVMFAGFAIGANDPALRWLAGGINIGVLLAIAWVRRFGVLHIPAQVYFATLLVTGTWFDIDAIVGEPGAALRLTGLLVLQAIVAEAMIRLGRRTDARYYAVGGGVTTVLAGVLMVSFAQQHPAAAALICATAALTWLGANLRWRFAEITYACAFVLSAAIFYAFRAALDVAIPQQLLWTALTHATVCLATAVVLRLVPTVCLAAAVVLRLVPRPPAGDWLQDFFRTPLQIASLCGTFIVVAILIVEQAQLALPWSVAAVACAWLAALWLVIAVLEGWAPLFAGFQVALGFAWCFAAVATLGGDWREPGNLHVSVLGLAVMSLGWEWARVALRARPNAMALLTPAFVPIDRIVTSGLVIGQYVLIAAAVLAGVGDEIIAPDVWRVFPGPMASRFLLDLGVADPARPRRRDVALVARDRRSYSARRADAAAAHDPAARRRHLVRRSARGRLGHALGAGDRLRTCVDAVVVSRSTRTAPCRTCADHGNSCPADLRRGRAGAVDLVDRRDSQVDPSADPRTAGRRLPGTRPGVAADPARRDQRDPRGARAARTAVVLHARGGRPGERHQHRHLLPRASAHECRPERTARRRPRAAAGRRRRVGLVDRVDDAGELA